MFKTLKIPKLFLYGQKSEHFKTLLVWSKVCKFQLFLYVQKSANFKTLLVWPKLCKFQNSSCMAKSLQISKLFLYGQKSANFKTCLVCSTHKGVKQCSRYVTQVQQQRPESPMVTLTKHMGKHKVHKLYLRHFLFFFLVCEPFF